jgi:hypothetical protein
VIEPRDPTAPVARHADHGIERHDVLCTGALERVAKRVDDERLVGHHAQDRDAALDGRTLDEELVARLPLDQA